MISLFRMRQRGVGGETSSSSSSSPSSSSLSAAASACVPNFEDATVSGYPPEDPHERPDDDPPPFAYEDEQEDRDIFECDDEAHANSSSNGNISEGFSSSSSGAAAGSSSSSSADVIICKDCGWDGHPSKRFYTKCPMAPKYRQKQGMHPKGSHAPPDYAPLPPRIRTLEEDVFQAPKDSRFTAQVWSSIIADHPEPPKCEAPEHTRPSDTCLEKFNYDTPPHELYLALAGVTNMGNQQNVSIYTAMASWTRRHADKQGCGEAIYANDWRGDITVERIMRAEAIEIANGVTPRPRMRDHFFGEEGVTDDTDLLKHFGLLKLLRISGTQAVREMEQTRSMLRFQNIDEPRPSSGEFKDDKAHLIRPVLEALRKELGRAFLLGENYSLDEIDIPFKGHNEELPESMAHKRSSRMQVMSSGRHVGDISSMIEEECKEEEQEQGMSNNRPDHLLTP